MIKPLTTEEVLALPAAVPLWVSPPSRACAALAFGMGRTKAYDLAKEGRFPCKVLPLGPKFVVPKTEILAALGLEQPTAPAEITDAA